MPGSEPEHQQTEPATVVLSETFPGDSFMKNILAGTVKKIIEFQPSSTRPDDVLFDEMGCAERFRSAPKWDACLQDQHSVIVSVAN